MKIAIPLLLYCGICCALAVPRRETRDLPQPGDHHEKKGNDTTTDETRDLPQPGDHHEKKGNDTTTDETRDLPQPGDHHEKKGNDTTTDDDHHEHDVGHHQENDHDKHLEKEGIHDHKSRKEFTRQLEKLAPEVQNILQGDVQTGSFVEMRRKNPKMKLSGTIIKNLDELMIENMNTSDVIALLGMAEQSYESIFYALKHAGSQNFDQIVTEMTLKENRKLMKSMDVGGYKPLSESIQRAVVDAAVHHWGKLEEWPGQSAFKISFFIAGFARQHIASFNEELFSSVLTLMGSELIPLRKSQKFAMLQAARKYFGKDIGKWSAMDFPMARGLISEMEISDLKRIHPDIVVGMIGTIRDLDISPEKAKVLVNAATKSKGWSWNDEMLMRLGPLVKYLNPQDMYKLPAKSRNDPEVVKNLIKNMKSGRAMNGMVRNLAKSFGDPKEWDKSKVEKLGAKGLSGLPLKDIKKLPPQVILESVASLADEGGETLSKGHKRLLVAKFTEANGKNKKLSAKNLAEMKGLITALPPSQFLKMESQELKNALGSIEENARKMDKTEKLLIIDRLKRSEGGIKSVIKSMGSLAKDVPLRELDKLDIEDLGLTTDLSNSSFAADVTWTRGQSKRIMRKLKSAAGDDFELSAESARNLGNLATGLTCDDLDRYITNDGAISTSAALMEIDGWTKRQLQCILQRVKESMNETHGEFSNALKDADMTALTGRLLKEFTIEELAEINSDYCENAMTELGADAENIVHLKEEKARAIVWLTLDCLNKTDQGQIDRADLSVLGYSVCGLSPADIGRINNDDFVNYLSTFHQCCLDENQSNAIAQKIVETLGDPKNWTNDVILNVGPLLQTLVSDQIEALNLDEFSLVLEDLVTVIGSYSKMMMKGRCFRHLGKERIDNYKQQSLVVFGIVINALLLSAEKEKQAEAVTTEALPFIVTIPPPNGIALPVPVEVLKRRKRQFAPGPEDDLEDTTVRPTCFMLMTTEEGNEYIWTDFLEDAALEEISECLGKFAYTLTQAPVVLEKLKQAWNITHPSDYTDTQLQSLDKVATAFTVSEIRSLNLDNPDTISALGKVDGWNRSQLEAGLQNYMDGPNAPPFSNITLADLFQLGHFVCGMTVEEIRQLSASLNPGDILESGIGERDTCELDQLVAFKDVVFALDEPMDMWEPEIFEELGFIVAAFTAEEFSNINPNNVESFKPLAISLIPPQIFASGFTLEMLRIFSQEQSDAVTPEQKAMLSYDQFVAIGKEDEYYDYNEYETFTTTKSSTPMKATEKRSTPMKATEKRSTPMKMAEERSTTKRKTEDRSTTNSPIITEEEEETTKSSGTRCTPFGNSWASFFAALLLSFWRFF